MFTSLFLNILKSNIIYKNWLKFVDWFKAESLFKKIEKVKIWNLNVDAV